MNLFGKDLWSKARNKEQTTFYDFAQHGILKGTSNHIDYGDYIQMIDIEPGKPDTNKKKQPTKEELKELTPKEVFKLGTLNIPDMKIVCEEGYLEEQIEVLKDKISLLLPNAPKRVKTSKSFKKLGIKIADAWEITSSNDLSGVYKYAYQEMQSMVLRLDNRRQFKNFDFSEWPYTTNEAIAAVLNAHTHLTAENCAAMIPDLPKEAIKQINAYNKLTEALCGKRTNFYLIKEKAKKSDVERRRDPILLAQSPFGFFWQILGAWDDEIKFLEEL